MQIPNVEVNIQNTPAQPSWRDRIHQITWISLLACAVTHSWLQEPSPSAPTTIIHQNHYHYHSDCSDKVPELEEIPYGDPDLDRANASELFEEMNFDRKLKFIACRDSNGEVNSDCFCGSTSFWCDHDNVYDVSCCSEDDYSEIPFGGT